MCIYGGHICIGVPNIKFLCLTLCKGKMCTDDADADTIDADANDDGQFMIVQGSLVDQPNEPKTVSQNV